MVTGGEKTVLRAGDEQLDVSHGQADTILQPWNGLIQPIMEVHVLDARFASPPVTKQSVHTLSHCWQVETEINQATRGRGEGEGRGRCQSGQ